MAIDKKRCSQTTSSLTYTITLLSCSSGLAPKADAKSFHNHLKKKLKNFFFIFRKHLFPTGSLIILIINLVIPLPSSPLFILLLLLHFYLHLVVCFHDSSLFYLLFFLLSVLPGPLPVFHQFFSVPYLCTVHIHSNLFFFKEKYILSTLQVWGTPEIQM